RVVRDLPGPDEVPERGQRELGLELGRGDHVVPELGAPAERGAQPVVRLALRRRRGGRAAEERGVLAEEEGDAVEARAYPHDLSGPAEGGELHRLVTGDAPRQDVALPERDRKGQALERDERLAQRRAPVDPVPVRQEAAVRGPLGRLDLLPERRERGAAETPQDVGLAPFALGPARPELAAHESVVPLEL